MPLDKPGCGVSDHTPDCLCDVHVTEPVSVMENWERDSFMIRPLLERMGHASWTPQGVLELLTKQLDLHDDLVAYNERVEESGSRVAAMSSQFLVSPGQRRAMVQMKQAGIPNTVIRSHMSERYGVELTNSNVSHIVARSRRRRGK